MVAESEPEDCCVYGAVRVVRSLAARVQKTSKLVNVSTLLSWVKLPVGVGEPKAACLPNDQSAIGQQWQAEL